MIYTKYTIAMGTNLNSDWKLLNIEGDATFIVQFPILSKPKLINLRGDCISRVYNDELNSMLRYIGLYEFNQIFSLKYSSECNEFLFSTLKSRSRHEQVNWSWQICRSSECIMLIDRETQELIVKVERNRQFRDQLVQVNIYKHLNNQLIIAILFTACVLLNQSKLFNQSNDYNSDRNIMQLISLK